MRRSRFYMLASAVFFAASAFSLGFDLKGWPLLFVFFTGLSVGHCDEARVNERRGARTEADSDLSSKGGE